MADSTARRAPGRTGGWALILLLTGAWLSVGCNPAMLAALMMPWGEQKCPPEFRLAAPEKDKDKEVTVAVMASFARTEIRPEVLPADGELAEKFVHLLRERCRANKTKMKFVPLTQVRAYQNRRATAGVVSAVDVGKHCKADYVIELVIDKMNLYEGSQLLRGHVELAVAVYDMHQGDGPHKVFEKPYQCEHPGTRGPVDAHSVSVGQFRNQFLARVARELSRTFAAYYPDELNRMDD
jgi:hypothetical protein